MKTRLTAIALVICLIIGALAGCSRAVSGTGATGGPSTGSGSTTAPSGGQTGKTGVTGTDILTAVSSYDEVARLLKERGYGGMRYTNSVTDGAIAEDDAEVPTSNMETTVTDTAKSTNGADSSSAGDYSTTNVQVAGIDEDDIVKTDGRYIYSLGDGKLRIFAADGENTSLISTVTVIDEPYWYDSDDDMYNSKSEYLRGMYIFGDRVAVLSDYYSYHEYREGGTWRYEDDNVARLRVYDVSDRTSPVLLATLGQDGNVFSTRLIGSTLYLVSSYYVYDYDTEIPEDYIPRLYSDAGSSLTEPDCISILPWFSSTEYTVVSSYDLDSCELAATHSILGGASQVYMTESDLYIATSAGTESESEPYTDGIYKVVDYSYEQRTAIVRIGLDGGLTPSASGEVTGYLDSQFSLDEYKGYLRLVTTSQKDAYSIYTDEEHGWNNYKWEDDEDGNNLFVLDSGLNVISSITDIAQGEVIYSARFFGDTGYFVTFRTTDPLFAVDLSNPASPRIIGELKLPGFSDYLHGWSEGRLMGLGMEADENTGFTDGMKLSMFDISDPKNLSEKHSLKLDTYYSEALYNHKAILVSPERGLIAFPADGGYSIYGYDDAGGFRLIAETLREDDWYYDADCRGLFIGDYFYVVSGGHLVVLEMGAYSVVADLEY